MSIKHIEEMLPEEFLHLTRNLSQMVVTEKLDGSNLVFGFDNGGQFFTSRESKGGKRFYQSSDYEGYPADNPFKAAHEILQLLSQSFRHLLEPGDLVEAEVLFGRQPNAIVYGTSKIVPLRMLSGSTKKLDSLSGNLSKWNLNVATNITCEKNGLLVVKKRKIKWKFARVPRVPQEILEGLYIEDELNKFEQWYEANRKSFKTKKALKEATKEKILPIKEILLDKLVRSLQPALRDCEVAPTEDFGIEGIVILDPNTGNQTKIVDKTNFTLINQFFHAVRNHIRNTSWFKIENYQGTYKKFDAHLDQIPSAYENMLATIAGMLGIPELGQYKNIARTIKKYHSVEEFVDSWRWHPTYSKSLKKAIVNALNEGLFGLDEAKQAFEQTWSENVLILANGKEVRYTEEIYERTNVMFAEIRYGIIHALTDAHQAQDATDLAYALYRKHIMSLN